MAGPRICRMCGAAYKMDGAQGYCLDCWASYPKEIAAVIKARALEYQREWHANERATDPEKSDAKLRHWSRAAYCDRSPEERAAILPGIKARLRRREADGLAAYGPSPIMLARKRKGMSQTSLAEAVGASQSAINCLEHRYYLPSMDMLKRMSDVLDTPMETLCPERFV